MARYPVSMMTIYARSKWLFVMLPLMLVVLVSAFSDCYALTQCTAKSVGEVFDDAPMNITSTQKRLKRIGHESLAVDGIRGKETTAALVRFCEDLASDGVQGLPKSMITELNKYAELALHQADWRKVVDKPDFPRWLSSEAAGRQKYFQAIQKKGGVLPITILSDYKPAPVEKGLCGEEPEVDAELLDTSAVYYSLTSQNLAELQQRGTILEKLQPLKGQEYFGENELKAEVAEILNEVDHLNVEYYSSTVVEVAEEVVSYRLTKQSFDKMRLAGIPDDVLAKLQTLQDLVSPGRKELLLTIESRLKPEPLEPLEAPPNTDETTADTEVTEISPVAELDSSIYLEKVSSQIEKVIVYTLTDQSFSDLKQNNCFAAFPDDVQKKIKHLKDIEYLDREQFLQALNPLWDTTLPYYKRVVGKLAQKSAKGVLEPINWSGGSCGCSPDLPDNKVIYGLYPFWWAMEKKYSVDGDQDTKPKIGEQQDLDFSALTRIGYYNVYLNENGKITSNTLRHWAGTDLKSTGFVRSARRYRTKLDLVVYTNVWHKWKDSQIQEAAKSVANKAEQQLSTDITDTLKQLVPFAGKRHASIFDGVTIYFSDYDNSQKKGARQNIAKFIEVLHQNLASNSKGIDLNIMIRVAWDEEPFIFEGLRTDGLPNTEVIGEYIDLILILLDEPTKDTKKQLRKAIEDEFTGDYRKNIQRKIVPVISSVIAEDTELNGIYSQLKDDLIYFEDNFKGVGLWPLPLTKNPDSPAINSLLRQYFEKGMDEDSADEDFLARVAVKYFPQLCNYVCPNRWLFRVVFDLLALLLVLLLVLSYMICRLRKFLRDKPWVVIALLLFTIAVFSASLVCDPFWKQRTDDVIIGLLAAAFVFALWRYIRKLGQGRLP